MAQRTGTPDRTTNRPRPTPTRSSWSRRPRLVLLLAASVASSMLAGCGQTDNDTKSATAGLPDLEQSLMAHQWLLDANDSTTGLASPNPVTLVFVSGNAASGVAPCNTYRTQVTLDGDDGVHLDAPAATGKACEQPVMDAEARYFAALTEVDQADVTDRSRLVLEGNGVRLSFAAFDLSAEIAGDWSIVDVRTPRGVERVLAGSTPTATFTPDRSVVVSTGCNSLHTRWTLDREVITFEPANQTLMACDQPDGIMDQEAALANALLDAATVELTPTTLTILDDTGSIVLVATRP